MSLRGWHTRFVYTGSDGSTGVPGTQGDPLLSLGEYSPPSGPNEIIVLSQPYLEIQLVSAATKLGEISDWIVRARPNYGPTPAKTVPQPGDWVQSVDGVNMGWRSRILSNDGTTMVFESPTVAGLLEASAWLRVTAAENLFPNVTEDQAQNGLIDHRLICMCRTEAGAENNFRFYTDPIRDNGCSLEIVPSQYIARGNVSGLQGRRFPSIADPEDTPFEPIGKVIDKNLYDASDWDQAESPMFAYSPLYAAPRSGSSTSLTHGVLGIWVRRTIPPNAQPGECAFSMNCYVDDAISQDATADGDPFITGFVASWNILPIVESLTLTQDRDIYTNAAARITGKVVDSQGRPLVNRYAFVEIVTGPGSVTQDANQLTDENGEIQALYTAPTGGGDQTVQLRLVLPGGSL